MSNLLRILNFLVWSDVIQKLSPGAQIAMPSPSTSELYREYYRRFLEENQHISLHSSRSKNHVSDLLATYPPYHQRKKKDSLICPLPVRKPRTSYRPSAPIILLGPFDRRSSSMLKKRNPKKKCSHSISDRQKSEGKKGTEKTETTTKPSLESSLNDSPCSNEVQDFALPFPTMTSTSLDFTAFPTPPPTDYIFGTGTCSCFEASRYTCCSEYCSDPSCTTISTISPSLVILPTPSLRVHPYATATYPCCSEPSGYYSSPSQLTATNMVSPFYPKLIPRSSQMYYTPVIMPVATTSYSQFSTSSYSCCAYE